MKPLLKKKFFIVFLAVFFIFSLNFFQKEVKGFFYFFSSPLQSFLWGKGGAVSEFFSSLFQASRLKQENKTLYEENLGLKGNIVILQSIQQENSQLREALGLGLQKEFQLIQADIIAKDITEDVITINKGTNDGIAEKMPVIQANKALVGKVVSVFSHTANVMLVSSKKSSFDVKINEKNITGLLKGEGHSTAFLDFVQKDKELSQGDTILTTNLGGIFPNNLLVGLVKEVKKNDTQSFQDALVSPFFTIGSSPTLFVIINFK